MNTIIQSIHTIEDVAIKAILIVVIGILSTLLYKSYLVSKYNAKFAKRYFKIVRGVKTVVRLTKMI